MAFLVISFETTDAASRAAVCARIESWNGVRLSENRYVVESDREDAGLFSQLGALLRDGHLWMMKTWQRSELSYLQRYDSCV